MQTIRRICPKFPLLYSFGHSLQQKCHQSLKSPFCIFFSKSFPFHLNNWERQFNLMSMGAWIVGQARLAIFPNTPQVKWKFNLMPMGAWLVGQAWLVILPDSPQVKWHVYLPHLGGVYIARRSKPGVVTNRDPSPCYHWLSNIQGVDWATLDVK